MDRAALDVALATGIDCGGWCPRGRIAEDGTINARYPLNETPTDSYALRTRWNVRDSDGTLILAFGTLSGGTALTRRVVRELGRALLVVRVDAPPALGQAHTWIQDESIRILNVAGPRGSGGINIYERSFRFLNQLVASLQPTEIPRDPPTASRRDWA